MHIHDHPDLGVSVEVSTGKDGSPVVNIVSAKYVVIQLNGRSTTAVLRKPGSMSDSEASRPKVDPRLMPTFWNPDGTQTTHGVTDLRGEEP